MEGRRSVQRRIMEFFLPQRVEFDASGLSPDLLRKILLRVDLETLVRGGSLVCRTWNEILGQKSFWVERARLERANLDCFPPSSIKDVPLVYSKLYYYKPFNRNLIKNHSGQYDFEGWKIFNRGYSDRMKVENPPVGCLPHPYLDMRHCFVTSFGLSEKTIIIDFEELGVDGFIMDHRPHITVSEWNTHRADCAAEYILEVHLLDEDSEEFDEEGTVFRFERRMEQWGDLEWQEVKHVFTNYPQGVRRIRMSSYGQDNQFWKGHYGSKMAHASIRLEFEFDGKV